jgi:DNA (cytosine-5)-methyltransferase 1
MAILELCAGYGGLGLAVQALTGDKVAYVAENGEAASLVLAERFPDAPNIGDITTYDFTQLTGQVDIITAGFSCQDISNAGPRKGISGERSRVWKDVARAVRDIRPRVVFLENVGAIRHRNRGLDAVLADLAALGYDATWTCIRASAVGAPHHRERWFCIAVPTGPIDPRLEVGDAEAGYNLPAAERSGSVSQDAHGAVEPQRLGPAPRETSWGGARTNP